MKFTIVYDNEAKKELKQGHGFSCLVEGQKNVLVDTGWDGHLLLSNMKKLGITLEIIDSIFLSHTHWDHIGGLPTILNQKNESVSLLPKMVFPKPETRSESQSQIDGNIYSHSNSWWNVHNRGTRNRHQGTVTCRYKWERQHYHYGVLSSRFRCDHT